MIAAASRHHAVLCSAQKVTPIPCPIFVVNMQQFLKYVVCDELCRCIDSEYEPVIENNTAGKGSVLYVQPCYSIIKRNGKEC